MGSLVVLFLIATGLSLQTSDYGLLLYSVSFWHYLLYWWAYRHARVAYRRFRADAIAMKTLALSGFAVAVLTTSPTASALVTIAAGFSLNAAAAATLGIDRTYYGWELGEVPHRRVSAFPYSLCPHPMLLGNVVAYAGALLSPAFRSRWWPLAMVHVAANVGLLVMETAITSSDRGILPRDRRPSGIVRVSAEWLVRRPAVAAGAAFAMVAAGSATRPNVSGLALLAAALTFHYCTQHAFYTPAQPSGPNPRMPR